MFSRLSLLLSVSALLASCGSVAKVDAPNSGPLTTKTFQRVLVKDFTHTVADDDGTTPVAARKFSDKIAEAIREAKPGANVSRTGKEGPGTLVITGEVTRYCEGSAALRFLVGMGAGSSYFDANVRLIDGADGKQCGLIRVDKNSWGLGGGIAASQTVDHFMGLGAKTTATEVAKILR
jgi:outer membrane receptor protein involved in Fe transport